MQFKYYKNYYDVQDISYDYGHKLLADGFDSK